METAVSVMLLQLLVATMLTLVIVAISHSIADQMVRNHQSLLATLAWALEITPPPNLIATYNFGAFPAGFWIGMSMGAGVWLGSCFPQGRWWTVSLTWGALLVAAMSAGVIIWAVFKPLAILADSPAPYTGPSLEQWSVLLSVVGASTLITLVCMPVGSAVRRTWRSASKRRWIKLLTSARRARSQS